MLINFHFLLQCSEQKTVQELIQHKKEATENLKKIIKSYTQNIQEKEDSLSQIEEELKSINLLNTSIGHAKELIKHFQYDNTMQARSFLEKATLSLNNLRELRKKSRNKTDNLKQKIHEINEIIKLLNQESIEQQKIIEDLENNIKNPQYHKIAGGQHSGIYDIQYLEE